MKRFFKKIRTNDQESSSSQHVQLNLEELPSNEPQLSSQQHTQLNLEELPSDPGKRLKISTYHPNDQERIRRTYMQRMLGKPWHQEKLLVGKV